MNRIVLFLALTSLALSACSSSRSGDASISMQDRREYEKMKYADPATGEIPTGIRAKELRFASTLPNSFGRVGLNNHDARASKWGAEVQTFGSFEQVGPYNVGGRTRALALDRLDPDNIFAGGVSGGIWQHPPGSLTWFLKTSPDEIHAVTAVVQDSREGKSNIWYYGTGEAWGNSAQISGNGIWKSTDNGQHWTHLSSTASDRIPAGHAFAYTWRIVTDPVDERDVVVVATARYGIMRSSDGGETWTNVLPSNSFFADVAVTPSGVYYAALSSFTGTTGQVASKYGIFRSINGIDWVSVSPPDLPSPLNRAVIGLVPGADRLFVIAETPGSGTKGVFRLRTGERSEWHSLWTYKFVGGDGTGSGGQWENRSANLPLLGGRNGDFFSQGGYDLLVRVSPHDTNLVIIGGTNTYRSTNAFRSSDSLAWIGGYGLPNETEMFPRWPNHHPDQHEVVFHPTDPASVYNSNDGGVMVTDDVYADTVQWTDLSRGYFTTQFYSIAIRDTSGDKHILGGMQDNGTWEGQSSNSVDPWTVRNGGDGGYCQYADGGQTLYVSTQQGRIRRVLLDESGKEIARTRVDPASVPPSAYIFISPFVVDYADENIMYHAGGTMLWRNNDLSGIPMGSDDSTDVNWDSLTSTKTTASITAVACSRNPAHVVYYGTNGGKVYRLDEANVGQPVPTDVSKGLGPGYVNSITVDRENADHVIATFSSYGVVSIYESFDAGNTWLGISGNLEENRNGTGNGPAVNWVEILPFEYGEIRDTVLVAATSTGLYFTPQTYGMNTVWTFLGEERIGNVPIDMLVSRYSDRHLFIATHGRGVFQGTIRDLPDPPLGSVALVSPLNTATGANPTSTQLTWRGDDQNVSYLLEVSTDPNFVSDVRVIDGLTDTTYVLKDLEAGYVTYYWRVSAFQWGGKTEPSDTWQFTTFIGSPTALLPEDRAEGVPGLPVPLTWTRVEGALSYDVEVSTNLAFNGITAEFTGLTDTTVNLPLLESGTRYFWHARAVDADTSGYWSQRAQFTTGVLVSVEEDEAPTLSLWPNPATTTVTVTLPEPCEKGTISVINERGQRVLILAADTKAMDVRGLSSGTYTVLITCGKHEWSQQLVIER